MSVNFNRNKANKCFSSKEIRKRLYDDDPYWEDYQTCKYGMYSSQYRSYKTWKYNRKTQYKL